MFKRLETAGRRGLSNILTGLSAGDAAWKRVPADAGIKGILLMRWDAIGDMMVCLPFFRKVRDAFPEARVGIIASGRNMPLLKHETGFETILYDSEPLTYLKSLVRAREFSPDAVVDSRMHYDSTTSFVYGRLSGARWMLSAENRRSTLPYNVRVPMPPQRLHNADMTRILLEGLGRSIEDVNLDREVRLSSEELRFADSFWRSTGLRLRGRTVGINMSARDPRHAWPENRVEELCVRLLAAGQTPVLFSLPTQRPAAAAIAERHGGVMVPPECPTILHVAALIRDMALFVTPDTGLIHIASSCGIPTVGLYTPNEGHLPLWHPWRVESEVVEDDRCVSDIVTDSVMDAVMRLSIRTGALEME